MAAVRRCLNDPFFGWLNSCHPRRKRVSVYVSENYHEGIERFSAFEDRQISRTSPESAAAGWLALPELRQHEAPRGAPRTFPESSRSRRRGKPHHGLHEL